VNGNIESKWYLLTSPHLPDRRCRFRFHDFVPLSFVVLVSRVGRGTQLSERSAPGCPSRQHRSRNIKNPHSTKSKVENTPTGGSKTLAESHVIEGRFLEVSIPSQSRYNYMLAFVPEAALTSLEQP
jgi:hypothetical protein